MQSGRPGTEEGEQGENQEKAFITRPPNSNNHHTSTRTTFTRPITRPILIISRPFFFHTIQHYGTNQQQLDSTYIFI